MSNSSPQLHLHSDHTPPGFLSITAAGEIDVSTADLLRQAVTDALFHPDVTVVHIDLGAVTFCDAAGINALITGIKTAADNNITYRIVNPQGIVRRVLTITDVLVPLTTSPTTPP